MPPECPTGVNGIMSDVKQVCKILYIIDNTWPCSLKSSTSIYLHKD